MGGSQEILTDVEVTGLTTGFPGALGGPGGRWGGGGGGRLECFFTITSVNAVARGDGKLECLCGKAGTSHVCDGSEGRWE